jgi:hypothetical protein
MSGNWTDSNLKDEREPLLPCVSKAIQFERNVKVVELLQ